MPAEVQRRMLRPRLVEHPHMRQPRPRPCRRLVMQLRIQLELRLDLPVRHHRAGTVALVHLDTMRVELVLLERERLAQRRPLPLPCRGVVAARIHVGLHLLRADPIGHPQRLEDRPELPDRLVGPRHDLLGDRRPLRRIAVEQPPPRLPLQHGSQLPREVEPVLNGGIRPEPVRRRMPVHGVPHVNTRPACMRVAYMLFTVQVLAEISSISSSGSPTSCRATPVPKAASTSGGGWLM